MYEHKRKPLISHADFRKRVARNFIWSLAIVFLSLLIGTSGYSYFGELSLLDAFYNASMILTAMGPVDPMLSTSGKLFASFYALYSGLALLTTVTVMLTPVFHRFMHKFHLDENE